MAVIEVDTFEEFNENIMGTNGTHTKKYVIVDFFATWCGPCKRFTPTYVKLSEKHDTVHFLKVDIDDVPEVAEKYDIQGLPTFMMFETGSDTSNYQQIVGADEKTIENKLQLLTTSSTITEDF